MRSLEAYQRQQTAPMPRIDLILTLFRKALDLLQRARSLIENRPDEARPLLTKAQLIVTALASGQVGRGANDVADNFLRLYEFISHRLSGGSIADVDAADTVLRTLFEAFTTVRAQAVALESQGKIPPLEAEHHVQVSA